VLIKRILVERHHQVKMIAVAFHFSSAMRIRSHHVRHG
jgi:hypothetical protein